MKKHTHTKKIKRKLKGQINNNMLWRISEKMDDINI